MGGWGYRVKTVRKPAMDLDDLYQLLPEFLCTPGCHECCRSFGVPSRTKVEDERIRRFIADNRIDVREARGTTCPYLVVSLGCAIFRRAPSSVASTEHHLITGARWEQARYAFSTRMRRPTSFTSTTPASSDLSANARGAVRHLSLEPVARLIPCPAHEDQPAATCGTGVHVAEEPPLHARWGL
jgi:hypothetical protein